ncbi:MAG: hypothetical protein WAO55_10495 [Candidatus Manganitrophaceae bacterium]
MEGRSEKGMIRLITEVRDLLPDLFLALGAVERLNPPPDLLSRIQTLRNRLHTLSEEARLLEEATDCMPAAETGRRQPQPG